MGEHITNRNIYILFLIYIVLLVGTLALEPFGQNPNYHNFADHISWGGFSNAWNVVTNLAFLLVGIWGFVQMKKSRKEFSLFDPDSIYFLGITLTAIGSSYYHWNPSNETLLWDRVPMTIAFNGFLLSIMSHQVSQHLARKILWPLLIMGMGTVFYWGYTESLGRGDLRFYFLTQASDMLLIIVILIMFRTKTQSSNLILLAFVFYAFAIFLEQKDHEVFEVLGQVVGGHPLKHLFAGLSTFLLGKWIVNLWAIVDVSK